MATLSVGLKPGMFCTPYDAPGNADVEAGRHFTDLILSITPLCSKVSFQDI